MVVSSFCCRIIGCTKVEKKTNKQGNRLSSTHRCDESSQGRLICGRLSKPRSDRRVNTHELTDLGTAPATRKGSAPAEVALLIGAPPCPERLIGCCIEGKVFVPAAMAMGGSCFHLGGQPPSRSLVMAASLSEIHHV